MLDRIANPSLNDRAAITHHGPLGALRCSRRTACDRTFRAGAVIQLGTGNLFDGRLTRG
jgi:hypothetical protein